MKHYKYFLRHDPKRRPTVLAADRRQSARRTARRKAARAADEHQVLQFPPERVVFGGWDSGSCSDSVTGKLYAVPRQ